MTAQCETLAAHARTTAETYPALRHALQALGDSHSHLRLPDAGQRQRGVIGLYFVGGVIAQVIPGSPADLAGLRPGDLIEAINGRVVGPGVNDGLLPDATLTFDVRARGQRRRLSLTRADAPLSSPVPEGRLIAPGVGLVTLPECGLDPALPGGSTYQEAVRRLLLGLAGGGAGRWVLDLRLNLGGNMWPMLAGVGPLAGTGELGAFVRDRERWPWRYADGAASIGDEVLCQTEGPSLPSLAEDVPVAVLISPLTASSGEIITLSFLGRPGTRLFGEATRGLTTSNSLYELSDGAALLIATAHDADRSGRVFNGAIEPEVLIATNWAEFQTAADPVLNVALTWLAEA
ncbi:S41 family peptidase [Deinococcus budaensis]|uniref:C-terminal processing protease CtpA/Prc n=1 Tax=Deinococcus budaensis TaxID=1665626 RepID=A0A7W8LNX3_9DEIO|nr:C-terminal processing protease CtpA/Prc [Deinococcus budaensis]